MKKAILYLFLLSYTTIVLKPVFPTIADTIAHVFWYSEHLATVHYEHGKYHVHYEYQQAARNTTPLKEASLPKASSDNEHLVTSETYHFNLPKVCTASFLYFSSSLESTHLNSDFLPPKI